MVRATVTDDGEVSIQGVTDMTGEIVDVSSCKVEERLALYEECRLPTCKGSRKAPTILARLNPDTPPPRVRRRAPAAYAPSLGAQRTHPRRLRRVFRASDASS